MTILIAEDDPVNLVLVKGILEPLGHDLVTVENGSSAVAAMDNRTFDLLVLDVMMPDIDGFALTRRARSDPRHRDVPILLLTALSSKNDVIHGFDVGASDYVAKPFHATELLQRVKAHLRMRDLQLKLEAAVNEANLHLLELERRGEELEAKDAELTRINESLQDANRKLAELASVDPLTGLLNRRKGRDFMGYEEERSRRSRKPMGVILVDIDHFKSVNDTFGHDKGDEVLRETAHRIRSALRSSDILIRWGGEEFLIILPESDAPTARAVAEKVRETVEQTPFAMVRTVTVSAGVSEKTTNNSWDAAISSADRALYRAKEAGRNRVVSEKT